MARAAITHPFWPVLEYPGRPPTLRLSSSGGTLPVFGFLRKAELFLAPPG